MVNLMNNRLSVLKPSGEWREFPISCGNQHGDCIEEVCNEENIEYANIDSLIKKGYIVFYNGNLGILIVYMPESITNAQLYQLELLTFEGVEHMSVKKDGVVPHFKYNENIEKNFSYEVIQSYYNKSNESNQKHL